jgi:NTE family protein
VKTVFDMLGGKRRRNGLRALGVTSYTVTVLLFCCLLSPAHLHAQPVYPDSVIAVPQGERTVNVKRPRVGLVLSGGGAKGLAHVGVIKVIEEAGLHVDVVTGVSMGAIVGGLYSISYSPDQLENLALTTDWDQMLSDSPERSDLAMEQKLYHERYAVSVPFEDLRIKLPSGVIHGQFISKLLSRLTWPVQSVQNFHHFPRPFACVATDLETGDAVVLDNGDLSRAIRASMSLPSVFTPVHLGDKVLIDGYVARNLPAEDALDLGADILIGVDVGAPLRSAEDIEGIVGVVNQTMAFQGSEANQKQRELVDILIEPDVVNDFTVLDFDEAEEIIRRGEAAARQYFDQFKTLADSLNEIADPARIYYPISADSIYISELIVEGIEATRESIVLGAFGEPVPGWISRSDLEAGIDRIYGSRYYELVTYDLEPEPGGTKVRINVVERAEAQLRVGFHYDSNDRSAIELNISHYNWLVKGSFATVSVRLGSTTGMRMNYWLGAGREARVGLRLQLDAEESELVLHDETGATEYIELSQSNADWFIGTLFSTRFVVGTGFTIQDASLDLSGLEPIQRTLGLLYVVGWYDSLDRIHFSTRGASVEGFFGQSISDLKGGSSRVIQRSFSMTLNMPLSKNVTLRHQLDLGASERRDYLPFPTFVLGGYRSLMGAEQNGVAGNYMQVYRAELQLEPWHRRFILLEADVGRAMDEWVWDLDGKHTIGGSAVTFGLLTQFGPISWSVYGGTNNDGGTILNIGYIF